MKDIKKLEREYNIHHNSTRYYWQIFYRSFYFPQKIYILELIEQELMEMWKLMNEINLNFREKHKEELNRDTPQKTFTQEELQKYNGENGSLAYIAVNGIVYDVTLNPKWGGGTHFGVFAGTDATEEFRKCHGGEEILGQLKIVGKLAE